MALTREQQEMARMLRDELAHASDEQLDGFLSAYACGTIAGWLLDRMAPNARIGFIASIRRRYPEAFEQGKA